jgi:pimeloyl-ACP methyl ester carboxylesterase
MSGAPVNGRWLKRALLGRMLVSGHRLALICIKASVRIRIVDACALQRFGPEHALDMLAVRDALNVGLCHRATHSTGGIIVARMLLMHPHRFGGCSPSGTPVNLTHERESGELERRIAEIRRPILCFGGTR